VIALVQHLDGVDFHAACRTLAGDPGAIKPKVLGAIKPKVNGRGHTSTVAEEIPVATFEYHDEAGNVVFATERIEFWNPNGTAVLKDGGKPKKSFRQKRPDPDRPGEWINNVDGVRVIPYRLPQVIEAIANGHPIVIVEGEGKCDLLAEWNIAATCNAGGSCKWRLEHSEHLRGADVIIIPDNDEAGYKHLEQVGASLHGAAARVRVLMLPGLPQKGDVIDWAKAGGTREQLDALIEQAPDWVPLTPVSKEEAEKKKAAEAEEGQLAKLAQMPEGIAAAREARRLAKELNVLRSDIDAEIRARRQDQIAPLQGYWVVEPAESPADGDDLIRDIIRKLRKHVVCSKEDMLTIALWIMLAWVHEDAAIYSPILVATSAEPESGKTTTLSLIAMLVPKAISSVEISKAALYRSIKVWQPSFIIDEFDTVLASAIGDQSELRSVINSGHTRGQGVVRCITDEHKPELFSTFCPKAIGMVGRKLPSATLSRCIFIELRRRKPGESIEKFKHEDDAELRDLRRRLRRWAMDNADTLADATPSMPDKFDNRRADNWRLQFAIADLSSNGKVVDTEWHEGDATDWGDRARAAAVKIEASGDSRTAKVKLLADIKAISESVDDTVIASASLADKLGADPEGEWHEFGRNKKPITVNALARMLKEHKIFPEQVRPRHLGGEQVRGYKFSAFEEAWSRYL
jgi:hypothetical protein